MKYLLLLPLALCLSSNSGPADAPKPRPKNVILLIGDGMGLAQVSAGFYANGKKLNVERFPSVGLVTTHSKSHLITDSAAGATAYACGCKTANGVIGEDGGKKACRTLLEDAESRGLATGLVVSCSITHATPAAFYAHVDDRGAAEAIAEFLPRQNVDLIIGGGLKFFNERKDGRNLYAAFEAQGYQCSNFAEKKLSELTFLPDKPLAWFAAREEPGSVAEGRDWLPIAAAAAPGFLQQRSEKGFFMMLEGSQIDWACHANDSGRAVQEMLDFDAAIQHILDFAQQDGQTLVVLTADHETGGLALGQGNTPDSLDLSFNTTGHTASLVPVYAYGPGATQFSGFMDNTGIYLKIKQLFGW